MKNALLITVLIILIGGIVLACRGDRRDRPTSLRVQEIRAEAAKRSLELQGIKAEGTLASARETTVRAPVAGLVETFIDTPQAVERGQEILTLSMHETELALTAKRNQLRVVQDKLDRGRPEPPELREEEDTDDEQERDTDKEAARAPADEGDWEDSQQLLENRLAQVESEIALAEAQLGKGKIVAPFDATLTPVVSFYARMPIRENEDLYRLAVLEPMAVRFLIPLEYAPYIAIDMPLVFVPYATPDQTYRGTLGQISSRTQGDHAFEASGTVANSARILKDGQKGEVHLKTTRKKEVLTIPRKAVVYRSGNEPSVFLITDKRVYLQKVKLGQVYDDRVEILDGLHEDDWVATSELDFLIDGDAVKIAKESPPPAPLPAAPELQP